MFSYRGKLQLTIIMYYGLNYNYDTKIIQFLQEIYFKFLIFVLQDLNFEKQFKFDLVLLNGRKYIQQAKNNIKTTSNLINNINMAPKQENNKPKSQKSLIFGSIISIAFGAYLTKEMIINRNYIFLRSTNDDLLITTFFYYGLIIAANIFSVIILRVLTSRIDPVNGEDPLVIRTLNRCLQNNIEQGIIFFSSFAYLKQKDLAFANCFLASRILFTIGYLFSVLGLSTLRGAGTMMSISCFLWGRFEIYFQIMNLQETRQSVLQEKDTLFLKQLELDLIRNMDTKQINEMLLNQNAIIFQDIKELFDQEKFVDPEVKITKLDYPKRTAKAIDYAENYLKKRKNIYEKMNSVEIKQLIEDFQQQKRLMPQKINDDFESLHYLYQREYGAFLKRQPELEYHRRAMIQDLAESHELLSVLLNAPDLDKPTFWNSKPLSEKDQIITDDIIDKKIHNIKNKYDFKPEDIDGEDALTENQEKFSSKILFLKHVISKTLTSVNTLQEKQGQITNFIRPSKMKMSNKNYQIKRRMIQRSQTDKC
ncbi:hypothetical protein pb186bvf_000447 [Paramecium bursaria]